LDLLDEFEQRFWHEEQRQAGRRRQDDGKEAGE